MTALERSQRLAKLMKEHRGMNTELELQKSDIFDADPLVALRSAVTSVQVAARRLRQEIEHTEQKLLYLRAREDEISKAVTDISMTTLS